MGGALTQWQLNARQSNGASPRPPRLDIRLVRNNDSLSWKDSSSVVRRIFTGRTLSAGVA